MSDFQSDIEKYECMAVYQRLLHFREEMRNFGTSERQKAAVFTTETGTYFGYDKSRSSFRSSSSEQVAVPILPTTTPAA